MMKVVCIVALIALASCKVYFSDDFSGDVSGWKPSKDSSKTLGAMKKSSGKWKGDAGFQSSEDARFYALTKQMDAPFSNEGKDLVIQMSMTHEQNIDCGGGYIKLHPETDADTFNGDSKYYVMFGPDICGHTKKVHFIFGYNGKNLLWKKEPRCESDQFTHFYTAVIKPDNTYEMYIDMEKKESGNLEDDWEFLEPKMIPDPEDIKPADWVDDAQMADPEDKKPEGYDDIAESVEDPEAEKPDDWDEDEDGEWEAPTIPNPEYKGEWKPKMIPNPAYKGVWKQKEIANPDYKADDKLYLYEDSASMSIDWWQVKAGSILDNVMVTDDLSEAKAAFEAYKPKLEAEKKKKNDEDEAQRKADEAARAAEEEDADEDDELIDDDEDRDEL